MGIWTVLVAAAACQDDPGPSNTTLQVASGREPNSSVSGTVAYRERLALTEDATLVLELRDVSYADAPAPLIARQTISGPGQVPIEFRVGYNRGDIDPRNTYSIGARIVESDGRLAFTNDTAYEVITHGNPEVVDMLLVLVQPPPDLIEGSEAGSDWRNWVEVPARVAWANLIPNEPDPYLRVAYYQPTIEGCARPGNEELEVAGSHIIVRVTLMQPPPTPWAIPCHEQVVELDAVQRIETPLEPGRTYRVLVNGRETTTFTVPDAGLGHTFIAESPVESVEVLTLESGPRQYQLRVVSGLPKGSGCSWFNGHEVRRREPDRIDVVITLHEIADPFVACTADYPTVETIVPLGPDLESGVEYTVSVNSETIRSFVAG
ncbi:MAG: YbaY family lipoprotein [Dehalococcoidia bacterium]|nr:YbaY family lipoprotein [Dehalococcoidia bacterium]